MLMKGQTEGAISTYMALLEKEPNNFNILAINRLRLPR